MDPQELRAILDDLAARKASGQPLQPQEQQIYDMAVDKGLIQPPGGKLGAPNTRTQVAAALRTRPKDMRPVDRNKAGAFDPAMDPSGNIASHRYGGTMASGMEGVPGSSVNPEEQVMHYAMQMANKGDDFPENPPGKFQTPADLAMAMAERQAMDSASQPIDGTGRMTQAADTEVRPWAQRTPAGYKERGLDPAASPLQPVARKRGAPLTAPSSTTMDEEAILRQLMGL